ncbi:MAG: YeeE/YedE family protein [Alphaproteobacteria bacterium]|nr:YeeE/YedE family protein [Alphaproteobacteria bacterium]
MIETDWIWGLVGGLMLGTASALYLLLNGRVSGISGILGNALSDPLSAMSKGSGAYFLIGLIAIPTLFSLFVSPVEISVTNQLPVIIIGGLLVGFGTRLGSGCTSGHGVCGISRLSARSIAATCIFMAAAGLTVFLTRHVFGVIS